MNVVASKTSRFARFVHSREAFENAASFMLARSAFAEAISAVRQRNSWIQKWMPGYLGNNAFRKVLLGCGYTFHPFSNRARAHAQKKTRQRVAQDIKGTMRSTSITEALTIVLQLSGNVPESPVRSNQNTGLRLVPYSGTV
ncbi:hypothetical protein HZH66_012015 [Vespula vulgaris]|uniref:Uncharacterized protein n=1 Tax=Vespula vulgaris TaxID=7454 RepID=A0A834JD67_VESVU|nr:hypothetical protein HZH66_012015 [Vespula vulgaris]